MSRASFPIFMFIPYLAILISGSVFALPLQYGPEHGNRPADVLSANKTYCLGQALVKFDCPLKDIYHKNGTPISFGIPELDRVLAKHGVYFSRLITPLAKAPKKTNDIDCRWIYWLQFPPENSLEAFFTDMKQVSCVVTVGKNNVYEPLYMPNDPMINNQWEINQMHCPQAWDYTQGDSNVVITICDMGTDVLHQDLAPNIWINPGEDMNQDGHITSADSNNVDNDQNYYIDDFYGWDFTDNDNNVQDRHYWNSNYGYGHGTHVAGCASARTDNGIGIASPGNKVRLMICRISMDDSMAYLSGAFALDAWSYADAMGSKIINNSWGSYYPDDMEQNQATQCFNDGMLVFGGSGNNGIDSMFYPAAYNNVIAVAASDVGDIRSYFSNYGAWIGITAPGSNILSTINTATHTAYVNESGTSMAGPTACGCMALLWSVMPGATNIAVRDTLFHTATNIDNLNTNIGAHKLGWGRVDVGKAVATQFPFDTLTGFAIRDTINGIPNGEAEPGDTVCLRFTVTNPAGHLGGQNIYYKLALNDTFLVPLVDSIYVGTRDVNTSYSSEQFKFYVPVGTPVHRTTVQIFTGGRNPGNLPFHREVGHFEITLGAVQILVVDDDGSDSFENYYVSALDSLHEICDVWHVASQGIPDTVTLNRYSDFFWFTGNRMTNVLSVDAQSRIQWLQQNGKCLLFSSQGAGSDLGSSSFHLTWLHASWSGTVSDRRLLGVSGDALGDGMNLYLNGANGGGAQNTQSANVLSPANGAATAWNYNITSASGVVYVRTNGHLNFVYCGFPVESINQNGSYVHRSTFFQRVLDQFRQTTVNEPVAGALPKSYALSTPYPNPFNPSTTIHFALPNAGLVKLAVFDVTGRTVATLLDGHRQAGNYSITWNAASNASGLYFIRMEAGNRIFTQKALLTK